MLYYGLLILATVILALELTMSKLYERSEGTSLCAGLTYNVILGLACAVFAFALGGFQIHISWFSMLMAFGVSVLSMTCSMISFQVLKSGGMGVYSMFLVSGGMLMPYLFAVLFLDETLNVFRVIGMIVILAAVILNNRSAGKLNRSLILLCVMVFILNGCVSIISKCHQIDTTHDPIGSSEFVMWVGLFKAAMSGCILLTVHRKQPQSMPRLKKALPIVLVASLFSCLTYLLQLISASHLPATVQYPIVTGGCIIFSTLSGKIIFKDKVSTAQWISVALCFAGTCLFL